LVPSESSQSRRETRREWIFSLCVPLFLLALGRSSAGAETPSSAPPVPASPAKPSDMKVDPSQDVEDRLRCLEGLLSKQADQIRQLSEENRKLADQIRGRSVVSSDPLIQPAQVETGPTPTLPSPVLPGAPVDHHADPAPPSAEPVTTIPPAFGSDVRGANDTPSAYSSSLDSGNDAIPNLDLSGPIRPFMSGFYDKGFVVVAPTDKQRTPFALKLNQVPRLQPQGRVLWPVDQRARRPWRGATKNRPERVRHGWIRPALVRADPEAFRPIRSHLRGIRQVR
jgi:hypothetical protein